MKEVKTSNLRLRISLNQMRRVGESLHFGGSQAENYPCPCNYQDNLEKELGYKCERNTVTFKTRPATEEDEQRKMKQLSGMSGSESE